MLTVYTQPNCQQCRMTKMYADKQGIPYVERALADSPDILDKAVKAGYTSAPVVVDDHGNIWGGYNPAKIRGKGSAK
jgi:glutaredoxin-like protein NrdH|nr:MAG TPA: NrdH [Caudoviricetes sp.]